MKFPIHNQSPYTRKSRSADYSVFDQFKYWYFDEFHDDSVYRRIAATSETNSPWHIEGTIGIHTTMVVVEYLSITGNYQTRHEWNTDTSFIEGAFACAFHDAGKPATIVEKHSEERGDYVSFPGHEQYSARIWEDWAVTNLRMLEDRFGLTIQSIYNVSWLIEHHLPWGIKQPAKRNAIAATCVALRLQRTFLDVLWADTLGRISKDATEKRAKVQDWTLKFSELVATITPTIIDDSKPLLVMPIGASGSGKTTVWERVLPELSDAPFVKYSLDDLRHEWYDPDNYTNAFNLACKDKEFSQKAHDRFMDLLKANKNVYCDNTNLSRKRRAFYVNAARHKGYTVIAIPLLIGLKELRARQTGRTDKTVPVDAVERHFFAVQQPQYGEFDIVHVHDGNLPKID